MSSMQPVGTDVNTLQMMAEKAALAHGVSPELLKALVDQESTWNTHAVSPVGAQGLGQLMPATASSLGVTDPFNPAQNLNATAAYLKSQIDRFGSVPLALAAYNAGPAAVTKYGGIPPYAETQAYVKNIMGKVGAGGAPAPLAQDPNAGPAHAAANAVGQAPAMQQPRLPPMSTVNLLQAIDSGNIGGMMSILGGQQAPQVTGQPVTPTTNVPQQPEDQHIRIGGGLDGTTPMVVGQPNRGFSNLNFMHHTDWVHVNPRLLQIINDQAKKLGAVATVISGYRTNGYSQSTGGFAGDPHTRGIAVDAYINGHPIGEVIPPDVWAKLGVTSGNTPGFYKGGTDPEHLQLTHIVLKGGKR